MPPSPSRPSPWRIGIAGLGRIAEIQIAALSEMPEFLLVAACDPDPARAAICPEGTASHPTLTALLAAASCDAIIVSTPTSTHFAVASEVIAAGHHLLLEKPAAVHPGEVPRLQLLAENAGVIFQTAFHMSRGAETDWLADHLATAPGESVRVRRFESRFHDPLFLSGTLHPRAPSVLGSWVDSGINALSVLARFTALDDLQIDHADFQRIDGLPVNDIQARVDFSGPGIHGTIHTDWTLDSEQKITLLHLTNGQRWSLDHNAQTATLQDSPEAPRPCHRHPSRMIDHYRGILTDFATALTHHQSNAPLSLTLHKLLLDATALS